MNHILATRTTTKYPYSFWQLRQDNPNISFPADPSHEDLATYNVFPVQPSAPPEIDQRTQRVEEGPPARRDGSIWWVQTWTVRPATPSEIEAYDAAYVPTPDWGTFKAVAMNSDTLNGILASAYPLRPVAVGALAPSLLRCESGDCADFAGAWGAICAAVEVPQSVIAGFVATAEQCHLPAAFVAALQPEG